MLYYPSMNNDHAQQLKAFLSNQEWRLNNLYWITNKSGHLVRFRMNWAQEELYRTHHTRNNILKVRQLGISTFLSILILDSCLFTPNFKAGVVDRTLPDAKAKLAKIKFAYNRLDYLPENPTPLDHALSAIGAEIKKCSTGTEIGKEEATFPNGSNIYAAASIRGGTLQLLHVSELGYIARHAPLRAEEIIAGCQETVGNDCHIYFESTHEGGKTGINYEQIEAAMANIGKPLTPLDYKFYFFPWFHHPEYRLEGYTPTPTADQQQYFDSLERKLNITLTPAHKAWYLAKCRTLRSKVKQEYPSTPEEALNNILDGTIFSVQLFDLMERGHLSAHFEPEPHRPIYVTWDIGMSDYMSLWWIQPSGTGKWLILANYTANSRGVKHYIDIVRQRDAEWGRCAACVLPHDGTRRDLNENTFENDIRAAGYSTILVPRTTNKWASIENTRELLEHSIIHARCAEYTNVDGVRYISGLDALKDYRTPPDGANGNVSRQPLHDKASHAADSLRTFADAVTRGLINPYPGYATHRDRERSRAHVASRLR